MVSLHYLTESSEKKNTKNNGVFNYSYLPSYGVRPFIYSLFIEISTTAMGEGVKIIKTG